MKNCLSRRMFCMLLCLLMCVSLCQARVFAEENTEAVDAAAETTEAETATAAAETISDSCGDALTWLIDENGVLTIRGTGTMNSWAVGEAPWFSQAESVTEVVLEEGVEEIASHAFDGCGNLQKVTVPASVTNISTDAFISRAALMEIDVDTENPVYSSENGVLFAATEEGKTLVLYPSAKEDESYDIPENVTIIGPQAFLGCSALKDVTIPSSVTLIGDGAFSACEGLTELAVPASVTSIGHLAFSACTNLSKVTFSGSAPEMGSQIFCKDTVSVYYPTGNDSWSEDIIEQLGTAEVIGMFTITWNDCACADIEVERTASPKANAECGSIKKGDTVYTDDELKVTYTQVEGYTNFSTGDESITVDRNITSEDIFAMADVLSYTVTWDDCSCADIAVERRLSPLADAECAALTKGDTVYYGDILQVTYTQAEGYTNFTTGDDSITVDRDITSEDIFATADLITYSMTWDAPEHATITVKRTESPVAGAETEELESGATLYHNDVLTVSYEADFGYSLTAKGEESITVKSDIGTDSIYAKAAPNDYTYTVLFRSENGTELGSEEVTYKFDTTNYVFAKDFDGYHTPSAKIVKWDAESKTIIFEYSVAPVYDRNLGEGTLWDYANGAASITYQYGIEYGERTADSVQVRIWWKQTVQGGFFGYRQAFDVGFTDVDPIEVEICPAGKWGADYTTTVYDSVIVDTGWITIPAEATQTTVEYSGRYWADNTELGGTIGDTIAIPAY